MPGEVLGLQQFETKRESFAIWGTYVKSSFSVVLTGSFQAASC
jgi:hypothetical protein